MSSLRQSARRGVAALLPPAVRRRVRGRAAADRPPEQWRISLVQERHGDTWVYRGRVGAGAVVTGVHLQPVKDASRRFSLAVAPGSEFTATLDPAGLWTWDEGRGGRFDLYLEVEGLAAGPVVRRMGRFAHTELLDARVGTPVGDEGATTAAWGLVTDLGNLSVVLAEESRQQPTLSDLRLRTGPSGLTASMVLSTFGRPAAAVTGAFVPRVDGVRHRFDVTVEGDDPILTFGVHRYRVTVEARPPRVPAEQDEGDVDVVVEVDLGDEGGPVHLGLDTRRATSVDLQDVEVPTTDDDVVQLWVPHPVPGDGRLALHAETFTRTDLAYLHRLHRWSFLFALVRPFSGVWLIGDTPQATDGNGFALFSWIREHHPRRRAHYVVPRGSAVREEVESLGHAVVARSRRHLRCTMLASRIVGSQPGELLHASRSARVARHARGIHVLLPQGVTAMRNVQATLGRTTMPGIPPDHVAVASERERWIVVEHLAYAPAQVHVAGPARYDALFADAGAASPPTPRLLVVPTWRDWFGGPQDPRVQEHLATWSAFLSHPDVAALQRDHGVEVVVVPHPDLRAHLAAVDLAGATVAPPDADLQSLVRGCAALVTDVSDLAWDAAFLDRPVAFLQHDLDRFTGSRTPFVDAASTAPGPLCRTPGQLAAETSAMAARGFVMEPEHRARAAAFLDQPHDGFRRRTFDLVRRADGLRVRVRRLRSSRWARDRYAAFAAGPRFEPAMARLFALGSVLPRRDTVMFETDRGKGYGGSPRAISERLVAGGTSVRVLWSANPALRVPAGVRTVRRRSPRWFWELSRARYWVTNQNPDPLCPRPRRTRLLQTWHGTPLKKMQNDVPLMYGRTATYHEETQRLVDQWSALVSPSEHATTAFRSAFGFDGPILQMGTPGNDVFHRADRDERARLARRRLGLAVDRRVVLYAPTFRDDGRAFGGSGAWSHDMALDLAAFSRRLGDEVTLLVRLHPLVRFRWPAGLGADVVDASAYADVQDLLLIADVLVTDYSSVMFDFAQTGRPIVLFTYDIEHYRDELRGFYVDLEEVAPGPIVRTSDDLIDTVAGIDEIAPAYADRLAAFRERFGSLEDGHAADRVVDRFFGESGRHDS